MRTLITTMAVGLAVVAPAAAAEAREPVTSAEVFSAAQRVAHQSAAGLEELTNGAVSVDALRVGNRLRYGKFREGASFTLFGTHTVNGETRTLWCVGNVEVVRAKNGSTRVAGNLTCPAS